MRRSSIVRFGFGCVILVTGCLDTPTDRRQDGGTVENERSVGVDEPQSTSKRLDQTGPGPAGEPITQGTRLNRPGDGATSPKDSAATSQATKDDRRAFVELSEIENRHEFEIAIDARFEELDRGLAMLEVRIFREGLRDRFAESISRLYQLRNEVALAIAEAETAPDKEFQEFKVELAAFMDKLSEELTSASVAVDRIVSSYDRGEISERLWL